MYACKFQLEAKKQKKGTNATTHFLKPQTNKQKRKQNESVRVMAL